MAVAVCAIVVRFTLVLKADRPARAVLGAALTSAVLPPAIGAAIYVVNRGQFGVFPVFFGHQVLSPFTLGATLVAGSVVALASLTHRPSG